MSHAVYLDANVLIVAFESASDASDRIWRVLDAVNAGSVSAVTSELTLAEVLPKPLTLRDELLTETYEKLVASGGSLEVVPVTRQILIRSARIRADATKIKLPDAIHLATALERKCSIFLTSDLRIGAPSGIRIVRPTDDSLSDIKALTV